MPRAAAGRPATPFQRSEGPPPKATPAPARTSDPAAGPAGSLAAAWEGIVQSVSQSLPSLAANLKKCGLRRADSRGVEIVAPANQFVSSMLQREKNLALLKRVCAEAFGGQPEVVVVAADDSGATPDERRDRKQNEVRETLNHPVVADAIEIFNGKLVDVQIRQEVDK
jgi:DNA polymerase-3 subunit gamma/tau